MYADCVLTTILPPEILITPTADGIAFVYCDITRSNRCLLYIVTEGYRGLPFTTLEMFLYSSTIVSLLLKII